MGLVKISDRILYKDGNYNSFPSAVTLQDGSLLIGFRQARERQRQYGLTHVDPSSQAVAIASIDGGCTWDTSVIFDHFLYGVQDPCLNVLSDGSLFGTFFTWKVFDKADVEAMPGDAPVFGHWMRRLEGLYSIRSADGGKSWDEPIRISGGGFAVRGNAAGLADGSLVLATYGGISIEEYENRMVIMRTENRGVTWSKLAVLAHPDYRLDEPTLHLTTSGKLVAFVRTASLKTDVNGLKANPLLTAESFDGGVSWSEWSERCYYSPSPFHALRLSSGNVLLTYGYRHAPYGIRAVLLDAECGFDHAGETILRSDGAGLDIGYTSAAQLPDGNIWVTYYYIDESGLRYIAGSVCREAVNGH